MELSRYSLILLFLIAILFQISCAKNKCEDVYLGKIYHDARMRDSLFSQLNDEMIPFNNDTLQYRNISNDTIEMVLCPIRYAHPAGTDIPSKSVLGPCEEDPSKTINYEYSTSIRGFELKNLMSDNMFLTASIAVRTFIDFRFIETQKRFIDGIEIYQDTAYEYVEQGLLVHSETLLRLAPLPDQYEDLSHDYPAPIASVDLFGIEFKYVYSDEENRVYFSCIQGIVGFKDTNDEFWVLIEDER